MQDEMIRRNVGAVLAAALAVALSPGCGNGRLSPMDTCVTVLTQAEACGRYRVGQFGGTDLESDIAGCTRNVMLFNDACQGLMSDMARCSTRGCDAASLEPCAPLAEQFDLQCAP
jgi:hypothetical protein